MYKSTEQKQFLAQQLGVPFESLSESYLRAETVLAATKSYNFIMQQTQVGQAGTLVNPATNQLLKQNDLFIVTHIGILLKKITTAGITDALQASAKLYTYPNPSIFAASNEAANLEAIYNGWLSFAVDRKIYIPALETRNFLRIPDAQAGAVTAAIAGPTTYTTPRDGFPNSLYGYYPTDKFQFDGQQTLDFNLNMAGAPDLTAAAQTNYVVMMLKGFLAQDQAANVKQRKASV